MKESYADYEDSREDGQKEETTAGGEVSPAFTASLAGARTQVTGTAAESTNNRCLRRHGIQRIRTCPRRRFLRVE